MLRFELGCAPEGESLTRHQSGPNSLNDLENLYWAPFQLDQQIPLLVNTVPHTVKLAAIQGFTGESGIVGFHTEPTDPAVIEMYFPLFGRSTAVVESPKRDNSALIQLETRIMIGTMQPSDMRRARFALSQGETGPILEVCTPDRTLHLSPSVIIPPGDFHGSLSAHKLELQPRLFALKLQRS